MRSMPMKHGTLPIDLNTQHAMVHRHAAHMLPAQARSSQKAGASHWAHCTDPCLTAQLQQCPALRWLTPVKGQQSLSHKDKLMACHLAHVQL